MRALLERFWIFIVVGLLAVAALFCIIGLSTKGWGPAGTTFGLFVDTSVTRDPAGLSIISFILLLATLAAFVVQKLGVLRGPLRYIPIALLFVTTIFLLSTFASFMAAATGFSYDLMVVAHFISYVTLALAAYMLGYSDATTGSTTG
jgi:hypothetical protein